MNNEITTHQGSAAYATTEARNAANDILTYLDLDEIITLLEIDQGELLTTLILNDIIDVSSLYAFLD